MSCARIYGVILIEYIEMNIHNIYGLYTTFNFQRNGYHIFNVHNNWIVDNF